jgi:hypothetical protein
VTWISDANGNKCSIEYFGSEDAARKALASLKECENCINCSYCSYCSRCSYCSDCSCCSDCSECSRCSGCSGCSCCSDCSECSRCSGCSECSGCSGCSECSRCSGCSECSGCSGCSRKIGMKESAKEVSLPVVPVVPDLHAKLYAAVSQPGALEMGAWHKCEKTHCRAGWVVALAGAEGKALEEFFNTELAAMKIYSASCPGYKVNPARFYDDNDASLADMKALAEQAK